MPNHCNNEVTLHCRTEEIALRIKAHLAGKESLFDFTSLLPTPEELLESTDDPEVNARRIAQYGHDGWYDWRVSNWGTKWNSYDCTLDDSNIRNGRLNYYFLTAWCPPEGICRKLKEYITAHALDIDVSWFYYEPMNGIRGHLEQEVGHGESRNQNA
jgi:hypothetical protein